jgi:hypothetical protein
MVAEKAPVVADWGPNDTDYVVNKMLTNNNIVRSYFRRGHNMFF